MTTQITTFVTPYTTTPSRQSPATFSADRDTRLQEEATRIPQQNSMATEMNAVAVEVNSKEASTVAAEATASAAAVTATAAAQTAISAPGTMATSTTELTIGTGSKTLTVQTGKSLYVGMSVKIAYTTTPTNWMHGDITAYNSETGSLTVNVTLVSGSGTQSAWTVTLSSPILSSFITVIAKTSSTTLSTTELAGNALITNTGAVGDIELTLQAGAADLAVEFEVTTAHELKFTAAGTDAFRCGPESGSAGGSIYNDVVGTKGRIAWNGSYWSLTLHNDSVVNYT